MYWALEHNTPFYGWGHAGRVESTAMTVLALAEYGDGCSEIGIFGRRPSISKMHGPAGANLS